MFLTFLGKGFVQSVQFLLRQTSIPHRTSLHMLGGLGFNITICNHKQTTLLHSPGVNCRNQRICAMCKGTPASTAAPAAHPLLRVSWAFSNASLQTKTRLSIFCTAALRCLASVPQPALVCSKMQRLKARTTVRC